jgi:hypothetical protein
MSNSKYYLFLSGILFISACGQRNDLHDTTIDQSFGSQQTIDSQMIIEDVDSSIPQKDSSLTEANILDASDANLIHSRNDAEIDSARESNVSRDIDSTSSDDNNNSYFIIATILLQLALGIIIYELLKS